MLHKPPPSDVTINPPRDPNTLSNYNNFKTTHTRAVLDVEFDQKRVFGTVYLTLKSLTHGESKNLILDTRYVLRLLFVPHVIPFFLDYRLLRKTRC